MIQAIVRSPIIQFIMKEYIVWILRVFRSRSVILNYLVYFKLLIFFYKIASIFVFSVDWFWCFWIFLVLILSFFDISFFVFFWEIMKIFLLFSIYVAVFHLHMLYFSLTLLPLWFNFRWIQHISFTYQDLPETISSFSLKTSPHTPIFRHGSKIITLIQFWLQNPSCNPRQQFSKTAK